MKPKYSLYPYQRDAVNALLNGKKIVYAICGCLAKGTPVKMADGSTKNVENIRAGDKLMSFDDESGKIMPNEVSSVVMSCVCPKPMIELEYDGERITTHMTTIFTQGMDSLRSISLSGERWKQAKGLSFNYFASNMGRIATIPFFGKNIAKIMSPAKDKCGYYRTVMDGKPVKVHRIIAETWLENPLNLPLVNHLDCNPSNNKIENLEWCSAKYNAYYGVHNGNIKIPTTSISHKKA